ncbi:MAG: alpha/beta fold hydrolase [Sandaracinaceae bacterium]
MKNPERRAARPWKGSVKPSAGVRPPPILAKRDDPFPRPHLLVRQGARDVLRSPIRKALLAAAKGLAAATSKSGESRCLARADATITGRRGHSKWAKFLVDHPTRNAQLDACDPSSSAERTALETVLQRLHEVDAHLRFDGGLTGQKRAPFQPTVGLRYIGIDAEQDTPFRPTNVHVTPFQQRDLTLAVPNILGSLAVRWVQAGAIGPNTEVILYLHGLGSRAEEADLVGSQLRALGDYAIVAPDLPAHGCTSRPPTPMGELGLRYDNGNPPEGFPYLEKMESFVEAFVRRMEREVPHFDRARLTVLGGSLGGTLSMRLSMDGSPFQPSRVAFWSPAGLWGSFSADSFKRDNIADDLLRRALAPDQTFDGGDVPLGRKLYFDFNFVDKPWPMTLRNAQRWWSTAFLLHLKNAPIDAAIADRVELYGSNFRAWQMRLAYEQLCFSVHHTNTRRLIGGEDGRHPVLLLCGDQDNDLGAKIFDNTVELERYLREDKQQAGRSTWFTGAGHSIHDECPAVLAEVVHRFVKDS